MTNRFTKLRRLGPLRRRLQPVSLLEAHERSGLIAACAAGAILALARASRACADG